MANTLKLTKSVIDRIPLASRGQVFYWDSELTGFGLRVGVMSKAYFAEWKVGGRAGRTVRKTIGKHGPFTPETARKQALLLLAEMQTGGDPFIRERRERVKRITLGEAFKEFLVARKSLKATTIRDYQYCFDRYFHDWHRKPLTSITREMVAERHALIGGIGFPTQREQDRAPQPSPAKANLAMRFLRALFNFAAHRYEPYISDNPVKHLSSTRSWYRVDRRRTYIKSHELGRWFQAVLALQNDEQTQTRETARDYLLLLLFTGLRRSEAARIRWEDIDRKARTMTLSDTKNREAHVLPLPDFLMQMIECRKREATTDYLFPGGGGSDHLVEPRKQVLRVCAESGVEFRLHDLRRTFATIAESLDIPAYALKRLLNHKVQSDVTAGYIVTDVERLRGPMQKIADFILKAAELKPTAPVISIAKKGSSRRIGQK